MTDEDLYVLQSLKDLFFVYGYYSFLCTLDRLEKEQKFEECNIILRLLSDVQAEYKEKYPTQLTEEVTREFLETSRGKSIYNPEERIKQDIKEIIGAIEFARVDYNIHLIYTE